MPDLDKKILETLVTPFPDEIPYALNAKYQDHLFEQYKLYVEMADRISSRRQTANSFFLSVNTVLIGLLSYLNISYFSETDYSFNWVTAIAGMALTYLWNRIIRSYRDLNTAKFKVIHKIESVLPLRPYDAEWEAVGKGENPKLYKPFTHIEEGVSWVFMILHFFIFSYSFPWKMASTIIDGIYT